MSQFVAFSLSSQRFALPLASVERILGVVEITPLPKAPPIILGIVNIRGFMVPVFDLRRRFGLPDREIELQDHLIVSRSRHRRVALIVDEANSVMECPEKDIVKANEILPDLEYVEGVATLDEGIVLIHNLDKFLSLEEEMLLDEAITDAQTVS